MFGVLYIQSFSKTDIAEGFDGDYTESGLFDNAQIIENPTTLINAVQETAKELEMNILIYIAGKSDSNLSQDDTERFADSAYDEIYGENTDGIFYYMDLSERKPMYDYISTSGKAILCYQKNMDNIFSRMDSYLPSSGQTANAEDVEKAVYAFLDALKDYSNYKPSSLEYYHDESTGLYVFMKDGEFVVSEHKPVIYNIILMIVFLVIGAVVAVITYFAIAHHYKFKKSQNPVIYAQNENTIFRRSTDDFIRTYTTKQKIETNSGGGGFSGGGGCHGGGGHSR